MVEVVEAKSAIISTPTLVVAEAPRPVPSNITQDYAGIVRFLEIKRRNSVGSLK